MHTRRALLLGAAAAVGTLLLPDDADARARRTRRGGRAARWPDELRLTLKDENALIDQDGYARYQTLDDLRQAIADGTLQPIDQQSLFYGLDPTAFAVHDPANRDLYAHVAPPVLTFLEDFVRPFAHEHGLFFQITSLTRPRDYQKTLARADRGAARATRDDNQSGHCTGHVVDLAMGDLGQQSGPARTLFRNDVVAGLVRLGHARARMERRGCLHVLLRDSLVPAVAQARKLLAAIAP